MTISSLELEYSLAHALHFYIMATSDVPNPDPEGTDRIGERVEAVVPPQVEDDPTGTQGEVPQPKEDRAGDLAQADELSREIRRPPEVASDTVTSPVPDRNISASPRSGRNRDKSLVANPIQRIVEQSKLPAGYPTNAGLYGGRLRERENYYEYYQRGLISLADRAGDRILRTIDEHVPRDFLAMLRKHPMLLLTLPFREPKRKRGNVPMIVNNIRRLKMDQFETPDDHTILIPKDFYQQRINLRDLISPHPEAREFLEQFDFQEGIALAVQGLAEQHRRTPFGVGEVLDASYWLSHQGGRLSDPKLGLTDVPYHDKVPFPEQQATDILDLIYSTAIAVCRRNEDLTTISETVQLFVNNYDNPEVLKLALSYNKRGRMRDSFHNFARLGLTGLQTIPTKDVLEEIRRAINAVKEPNGD